MLWEVDILPKRHEGEIDRVREEYDLLTHGQRGQDLIVASSRGYLLDGPLDEVHLQTLLETLANRGFTAYLSQVYASANEITAVHVHVPGLEHFHLIADGPSAVLPGRRALTAAQAR